MSSASSNSNDPVICKTVIDYEEYQKLKKLESKEREYYKAKTEELKEKVIGNDKVTQSKDEASPETTQTIQEGSGLTDFAINTVKSAIRSIFDDLQTNLIETLTQVIENKLSSFYQAKFQQTGKGDLVQLPADDLPESDNSNTSLLNVNVEKALISSHSKHPNHSYSQNELEKLMQHVPSNLKKRARKLLHFIGSHPLALSWDTNGTVTLNGVTIPGSNFYDIFSALYQDKTYPDLKGFYSVVTFILSSGQGNLIKAGKTKGLSRKRKLNLPPIDHNEKKWYKLTIPN